MNTEQLRAEFEEEIRENWGFAKLERAGGDYIDPETQGLWGLWNRRAALQSQDREDAERYRWLRLQRSITDLACVTWNIGHDWVQMDGAVLDEAIDHARRVEGGGK